MSNKTDLTKKFTSELLFHHFSDEYCKFFNPETRELYDFLFPLKDSLDKQELESFENALNGEVDVYAYTCYQNGFKDGVRHLIGMLRL